MVYRLSDSLKSTDMTQWLLCCLYLSGGTAYMFPHADAPPGQYWRYDINDIVSPYGIAEAGWSKELGHFTFELAGRHISSLGVDFSGEHNLGQNTIEARVKWFPWRK